MGTYPDVSLKEARKRRDAARELLAVGNDPGVERRKEKRRQEALVAKSFEIIAREWHEHQKGRWSQGHAAGGMGTLEKDVFAALGRRSVTEITSAEVLDVIRAVESPRVLRRPVRLSQATMADSSNC